LTGAGDGNGIGLRRYVRAHRREHAGATTAIIGVDACTAGRVRWWRSDGRLFPLLYAARLKRLATRVATDAPCLEARPYDGRGGTPALAGRMARIPSIAIGCPDERGLVPRSHQRTDPPAAIDPAAPDAAVQFGLLLVDAVDA